MDIFSPFMKAVDYVLDANFSMRPQWDAPRVVSEYPLPTGMGVAVSIGITGALRGHMAVALDVKTALSLAAAGDPGAAQHTVNKEVQSLLREWINMASGNAIARLAALGVVCDITTPGVVTGNRLEIHCDPCVKTVALPFTLNRARLTLLLTLMKNRADNPPEFSYRIF